MRLWNIWNVPPPLLLWGLQMHSPQDFLPLSQLNFTELLLNVTDTYHQVKAPSIPSSPFSKLLIQCLISVVNCRKLCESEDPITPVVSRHSLHWEFKDLILCILSSYDSINQGEVPVLLHPKVSTVPCTQLKVQRIYVTRYSRVIQGANLIKSVSGKYSLML